MTSESSGLRTPFRLEQRRMSWGNNGLYRFYPHAGNQAQEIITQYQLLL